MSCVKIVPFVYLLSLVSSYRVIHIRPGVLMSSIKQFWNSNDNGTVSKFPPIIEYFVQRIQSQNSNYIHEDLSRPPTWEKPVYTLSPSEQLTAYQPLVTESVTQGMNQEDQVSSTTPELFEYEELEETTEKFFEIITGNETRVAVH